MFDIEGSAGDSSANYKRYKFLVLGDSHTGKTALMRLYTEGITPKKRVKETIGCDIHLKCPTDSESSNGRQVLYEFWEIAGENKYKSFVKVYTLQQLEEFCGVIYVFEVNNIKTLSHVKKRIRNTFDHYFSRIQDDNSPSRITKPRQMPILFVGNKIDLIDKSELECKKYELERLVTGVFPEMPNTDEIKISFVSLMSAEELDLQFIDNFVQNAISKRFESLFYIDNNVNLDSRSIYRHYAKEQVASVSGFFGKARIYLKLHFAVLLHKFKNPLKKTEKLILPR